MLHNGDISVYSEGEGCGCSITIELPIIYSNDAIKDGQEMLLIDYDKNHNINNSINNNNNNTNNNNNNIVNNNNINNNVNDINNNKAHSNSNENLLSIESFSNNNINNSIPILLVDDSAMNRKMISRLFNNRNHNQYKYLLIEYENGLDAFNHISKEIDDNSNLNNNINIILIDNQMPIMDGITSVLLMRKKQYKGYIIMITGDSLEDDMDRMLQAGVNHILIKPIIKIYYLI